jgi:hemerythrin-like metal-binding protein
MTENQMMATDAAGLPQTGDAALDAAHQALYAELRRIALLPPPHFAVAFPVAVDLLERDFREEEDLMEQLSFPGLPCHREQHARALAGLHHAVAMLDEGDELPARHAIDLLVDWLALHIATMDVTLVAACDLAGRPRAAGI